MKMFTNCSGECCVCANGSCCIAGHGDDDFSPASKYQIIRNLDEGKFSRYTDYMIKYLADKFGYDYVVCKEMELVRETKAIPIEWITRYISLLWEDEKSSERTAIEDMIRRWEKENE